VTPFPFVFTIFSPLSACQSSIANCRSGVPFVLDPFGYLVINITIVFEEVIECLPLR
jgi:hypothetical protein